MLQRSATEQQAMAAAIAVFNDLLGVESGSSVDTKMDGQEYPPSPVGLKWWIRKVGSVLCSTG